MSDTDVKVCPKCGGELGSRGIGESWYGTYEFNEWYCLKCGYCQEQYYYDEMEKEV